MLGENFFTNYIYIISFILFAIGFAMLVFDKNLIKKILGMDIMDCGVYLFLTSMSYIRDSKAPIGDNLSPIYENGALFSNPIPPGLVLTGIVVSVSVSAIMLALCIRVYKKYRTLDLDKIFMYEKRHHDLEK